MADFDPNSIKWDAAPVPVGTPPAGVAPSSGPVMATAPIPDANGISWDAPPSPIGAPVTPPNQAGMSEGSKVLANTITGLQNAGPALLGLPHTLGQLGDWGLNKIGLGNVMPTGFVANHTYSADDINKALYDLNNATVNRPLGLPDAQPYAAETPAGELGQSILSGVPLALAGGGGIPAAIGRQFANAAGTTAGDVAKNAYPDSPGVQIAASLLGAVAGDRALPVLGGTANMASNIGGKLAGTKNAVNTATARNLVNAASDGATGPGLAATIDQNLPQWNIPGNSIQPAPTTATVTMNPGLQGMTYRDMTAAEQRNNPVYRLNASQTNQAQREGVANVTPDISTDIQTAQTNLGNAVNGLPAGVTAQDAGSQFRTGLQSVYDQRVQNRQTIGNNAYAPLQTSDAQINFQPVIDYATTQMASIPGDVGQAYQRALSQFSTGSGLRLDTPQFGAGVLSALGDLADSYPGGSAAQRAVLDVKNRADQIATTAEPAIGQARSAYATASRPLDVFDPTVTPGPIANAVQQGKFGGGYVHPNDSVVSQFLSSKGGPDAIDALTGVFPDVKSATQSLQDYIASQVKARAVNADGSVNQAALASVIRPYQPVLAKSPFADLSRQFSTLDGAQTAVDGLAKRQNLYETFANGLGLQAQDMAGVPIYSAKKFGDFLAKNQGDVVAAYGQPGATRLNQINKQLQDAAQTAQSRVTGTSGTAQSAVKGPENVLGYLIGQAAAESGGDVLGAMVHGVGGTLVGGSAGKLIGLGAGALFKRFNGKVAELTTSALSDPTVAKNLLVNYNPRQVRPIGQKALDYVKNRLSGVATPVATTMDGGP